MASRRTIGSRISASSAQTAPPHSILTASQETGSNVNRAHACTAGRSSFPGTRETAIALKRAVCIASPRGRHDPTGARSPGPSYEQLMTDLKSMSMLAVGRRYGVSDNAVRKWIRWYEYQREMKRRQDEAA